jgi:hypothetical protein
MFSSGYEYGASPLNEPAAKSQPFICMSTLDVEVGDAPLASGMELLLPVFARGGRPIRMDRE